MNLRPEPRWQRLGDSPPSGLTHDRVVLHHAAQLLASFGQTFVEERTDDRHRSMTWHEEDRAFLSEPAADGLRAALRVADLRLELRGEGSATASLDLSGRTVAEARKWLESAVRAARRGDAVELAWPEYEIPARPDGPDAPLAARAERLDELARWYQDAFAALTAVAGASAEASPVRCWPHHFDIATLMTFPGEGSEPDRHVGVGLSPGDGSYAQPYFYVNGWPAPDPGRFPALAEPGRWHTRDWVGAVLPAEAVTIAADEGSQQALVADFLGRGVEAMRRAVLG